MAKHSKSSTNFSLPDTQKLLPMPPHFSIIKDFEQMIRVSPGSLDIYELFANTALSVRCCIP